MRKKVVDNIDFQILNEIQKNPKVTNVELSSLVGLSPAPTLMRVQKLVSRDILSDFKATINFEAFKLEVTSICVIAITAESLDTFRSRLMSSENTIDLYECKGSNKYYNTTVFIFKVLCHKKDQEQKIIEFLLNGIRGIISVDVFDKPRQIKDSTYIFKINPPD